MKLLQATPLAVREDPRKIDCKLGIDRHFMKEEF